jgi:hypothetical protein
MRKFFAIVMIILTSLFSVIIFAEEKDSDSCKAHPMIPRIPEYYISDCNAVPAEADIDIIKGEITESVHFEGKSSVFLYMPQPDTKTKLSETQLRSDFGNAIEKMNGILYGITYGQKWPVYKIEKDGKKFWIILLVDSGEYYNGSYACRIIENDLNAQK